MARLRGTLQFSGAGRTMRWAGRTFQPQNLPRPTWSPDETDIGIIKAGMADIVYGQVMEATSNAIRGCIVAAPGKKLVVADLANIEGRCAAWLAQEDWKLDAFRAYDAGTAPDLYKLAYSKSFGVAHADVNKEERQIGKVQELMLGYQGGVGAYVTGALTYGIDLVSMAERAWPSLPPELLTKAVEMLAWHRENGRDPPHDYRMTDETWLVCECFVLGWRDTHPMIRSLWKDLERTAKAAVGRPGYTFECRRFKIRRDGAWLRIALPSGRSLCYPQPRLDDDKLSYMGLNQYSRKWSRLNTYGGKLFENACQALACHVMKDSMPRIEDAGFEIVLTVHDEVVTEAPGYAQAEVLSRLLATNHAWCHDMPLAAAGYEAQRYRKE